MRYKKTKKLLIIVFALLSPFLGGGALFSQNLVQNPSFEDTIACPINPAGQEFFPHIGSVADWISPTQSTPDYFNACAPYISIGSNLGVPYNSPNFGWQYARTGNAYVGIGNYTVSGNREYIQSELIDSLRYNHRYCVEFYVNSSNLANFSTNNIGLYISDFQIVNSGGGSHFVFSAFIPQINETSILNDTLNWVNISGNYMAHGGEKFITIGNFNDNVNTDTLRKANNGNFYESSYYYIDDVTIIDCTGQGIKEEESKGQCTIYPNPAKESITVDVFGIRQHTAAYDVQLKQINIYNTLGENVLTLNKPPQPRPGECTIKISSLAQGVYFVEIITDKTRLYRKVVKE